MYLICEQAVGKPVRRKPLVCVQWKTPDDGQRNCPKHVEFYSKNKFEKLVHLVGFIVIISHDARSPKLQTDKHYSTHILKHSVLSILCLRIHHHLPMTCQENRTTPYCRRIWTSESEFSVLSSENRSPGSPIPHHKYTTGRQNASPMHSFSKVYWSF